MFVSGFTFVRNAVKYDYPVVESIRSMLPLCDEVIVAVGNSEDSTRELVADISPKVRILDTIWDDSLREGGRVLAVETDKALKEISPDADWALYLQGDEVLHEDDAGSIRMAMEQWKDDRDVEGLLFDWHHFYGSYHFVADSRQWYRHEVRVIRPNAGISSFGDAMGFRRGTEKLRVKRTGASVYHYGWVKDPRHQQAKQESFHKMWHSDDWIERNIEQVAEFDYSKIDSLVPFEGTHPGVMIDRIASQGWEFNYDRSKVKLSLKERSLRAIERITGLRIGEYKNYRII